jgi:hypothetical protein
MSVNGPRIVWLWEAGRFCGVTDDRGRAMEHAEEHLAGSGQALVERAAVSLGIRGTLHVRTGQRWTARLACGRPEWTEAIEADAS